MSIVSAPDIGRVKDKQKSIKFDNYTVFTTRNVRPSSKIKNELFEPSHLLNISLTERMLRKTFASFFSIRANIRSAEMQFRCI